MAVDVRKITNANVYFDGASYLGKVSEVTLPDVSIKQADHQALGMVFMTEIPTGFDKMELEMNWTSIIPDAFKKVSNAFNAYTFEVRSSLERYEGTGRVGQDSVVVYFRGMPKNIPGGAFKQHENWEGSTKFNINYFKLEVAGETIYELDVLANIYKVDGVDLLATFRANLGI